MKIQGGLILEAFQKITEKLQKKIVEFVENLRNTLISGAYKFWEKITSAGLFCSATLEDVFDQPKRSHFIQQKRAKTWFLQFWDFFGQKLKITKNWWRVWSRGNIWSGVCNFSNSKLFPVFKEGCGGGRAHRVADGRQSCRGWWGGQERGSRARPPPDHGQAATEAVAGDWGAMLFPANKVGNKKRRRKRARASRTPTQSDLQSYLGSF